MNSLSVGQLPRDDQDVLLGVGGGADIADAVAFFASDDGRWVTGQTLEVNGGLFLGPKSPSW
ncbi:SDR family oxidoreductase [Nocardia abscessus]|uniref:SDR family oxidoreductase n=1 Tax=Nocardia abscessus TaxID=120957 RepID=UPI0002DFAF37|nr:SDR family oxidoreductase [Nocardia abscessus]MCC3332659.1 SDR family oxidoreductase [Nocardia abscessus]